MFWKSISLTKYSIRVLFNIDYLFFIEMEKESSFEKRRIQGLVGDASFTVVLPKKYAIKLGISKGDYVTISEQDDALIIKKG